MNTFDAVNALLTSQHYQDHTVSSKQEFRLRSGKTFRDLAEQATYVLWNDLATRGRDVCLDVHRFPELTKNLHDVLSRHIGVCEPCSIPEVWDNWPRTGGGVPTEAQTPPVCDQHADRLTNEYGGELAGLIKELKQAACEFTHHGKDPEVHQAVEKSLKPFLIKNLATRYCETCEQEFRAQQAATRTRGG